MDNVKVNSTNDSSNENDFTAVNLTDIFSAGTSEVDISSLPVSVGEFSLKTESYSTGSVSRSETVDGVTTESSEQQSTVSQMTVEDGVLNEVTTTTHITTVDGVTSKSSTTETRTIVLSPDMNFSDIIEQYSSLATENVDYAITGRNGNSEQHFDAKNSDSYISGVFYDVGNRDGYLSDFSKQNGVINFVDNAISSYIRQNDYLTYSPRLKAGDSAIINQCLKSEV